MEGEGIIFLPVFRESSPYIRRVIFALGPFCPERRVLVNSLCQVFGRGPVGREASAEFEARGGEQAFMPRLPCSMKPGVFGEGELYTWGSNENGCLGLGGTDAFHTPQKVESPSLKFPVSESAEILGGIVVSIANASLVVTASQSIKTGRLLSGGRPNGKQEC
ncbi:hypothetical protein ACLOJK_013821 [Asimina triloba]